MRSIEKILGRIPDSELRAHLSGEKGGQFARAVASEIDELRLEIASANPGHSVSLMTDVEAAALDRFLSEHFLIAGYTPQPGERLVSRVMMTLKAMYEQVKAFNAQK